MLDLHPLSLTYNSSNGVGFAGRGWTLNLSSIVRKGASGLPRFVDDVLTNTSVTSPSTTEQGDPNADDYYVDGHLLVPILRIEDGGGGGGDPLTTETFPQWALQAAFVPGTPGAWTYFRTEVDDGRRYFLSSDGKTWRVQTKSGHLLEYGHPTDKLFGDGTELGDAESVAIGSASAVAKTPAASKMTNAIYRWNLVRDTDASANTVYYIWSTLAGQSGQQPNGVQYLTDAYDTMDGNPGTILPVFAHHAHLVWTPSATIEGASLSNIPSPIWRAVPQFALTGVDVTSASFRLFVEGGGSESCGMTPGHGWGDAEGEKPANAIVVADGVGGHEAQLT